jgi:hypothetical protein
VVATNQLEMMKEFYFGSNRRVVVKKDEDDFIVIIEEIGEDLKNIKFTAKRFVQHFYYNV